MNIELKLNYFFRSNFGANKKERVEKIFSHLDDQLHLAGYPAKANYALRENNRDDCLLLSEDGGFWVVCYSERGVKFSPAFFSDIDEAVQFFVYKLSGGTLKFEIEAL